MIPQLYSCFINITRFSIFYLKFYVFSLDVIWFWLILIEMFNYIHIFGYTHNSQPFFLPFYLFSFFLLLLLPLPNPYLWSTSGSRIWSDGNCARVGTESVPHFWSLTSLKRNYKFFKIDEVQLLPIDVLKHVYLLEKRIKKFNLCHFLL